MSNAMVAMLPHLLAGLNLLGVLLLLPAYWAIRSGHRGRHQWLMVMALVVGLVFLLLYLTYHWIVGHVPFTGQGWIRIVYFSLLAAHVLMALVTAIMVPMTALRALGNHWEKHVAIARRTLPLWLFVCISGLVVYVMAFFLYPPPVT
ncbi:MAG: DUF420 domain-containing protein [Magnetococcales bacterium]|nr:DUF420 domain-containing protein [Magnetococcales bacterium]MBF0435456.1 DUF420 domain-containing protein [Magnetococcales bacterium]